ncbi:MAG: hypothetical protein M1831_002930 [Alyxoria varia]|nr:MAG: hypothetical protein M1831_002930 [Alyxoria varia]
MQKPPSSQVHNPNQARLSHINAPESYGTAITLLTPSLRVRIAQMGTTISHPLYDKPRNLYSRPPAPHPNTSAQKPIPIRWTDIDHLSLQCDTDPAYAPTAPGVQTLLQAPPGSIIEIPQPQPGTCVGYLKREEPAWDASVWVCQDTNSRVGSGYDEGALRRAVRLLVEECGGGEDAGAEAGAVVGGLYPVARDDGSVFILVERSGLG